MRGGDSLGVLAAILLMLLRAPKPGLALWYHDFVYLKIDNTLKHQWDTVTGVSWKYCPW